MTYYWWDGTQRQAQATTTSGLLLSLTIQVKP